MPNIIISAKEREAIRAFFEREEHALPLRDSPQVRGSGRRRAVVSATDLFELKKLRRQYGRKVLMAELAKDGAADPAAKAIAMKVRGRRFVFKPKK